MLYGSETWYLKEADIAILRRTERALVRSMCGIKLPDRKKNDDLMEMLGLEESVERLVKAFGVRWYGHVLRRDELHPLRFDWISRWMDEGDEAYQRKCGRIRWRRT